MMMKNTDLTALANISRISTEDFPRVSIHLEHLRMMMIMTQCEEQIPMEISVH